MSEQIPSLSLLDILGVLDKLSQPSQPVITVWRYEVQGTEACGNCYQFEGEVYELEDKTLLEEMFPYGEWVDDETFAPEIHPNCQCLVMKTS